MKLENVFRTFSSLVVISLLSVSTGIICHAANNHLDTEEDSETKIRFQYPSHLSIAHTDLWMIPTKGVSNKSKLLHWNIFNTDFYTGTLTERVIRYSSVIASSDGPEGGTSAEAKYIMTVKSKSQDDILIFELKIRGTGHSKKLNGKPAGFMMALDLKPNGTQKYRHLFLHCPTKACVVEVAKTVEVPPAVSLL